METELILIYSVGGLLYGLLEIVWRGWTHWSMILCGGLCFTLMYLISAADIALIQKWILSAAAITTVEFLTGCIVNLRLGWQIWDYSSLPYNLLLMWLCLSVPGIALCERLRTLLSAQ